MPLPRPVRRSPLRFLPALLSAVLLLGTSCPALADFEAGRRAYEHGHYETALKEWLPLAEAGDEEAQFRIGELYAAGEGVEQDFRIANTYHLRAALQGHAEAQQDAGDYLTHDDEAPGERQTLGIGLLLRAATNGVTYAYGSLSLAYCFGHGVEEDPVLADVWMALALEPYNQFRYFQFCDVFAPRDREYHEEILRRAEALRFAYGLKRIEPLNSRK